MRHLSPTDAAQKMLNGYFRLDFPEILDHLDDSIIFNDSISRFSPIIVLSTFFITYYTSVLGIVIALLSKKSVILFSVFRFFVYFCRQNKRL